MYRISVIMQVSLFYCFYGTIHVSYRNNHVALGMSHAVSAGSQQVTAALKFVIVGTAHWIQFWFEIVAFLFWTPLNLSQESQSDATRQTADALSLNKQRLSVNGSEFKDQNKGDHGNGAQYGRLSCPCSTLITARSSASLRALESVFITQSTH
jgi:hypothetical protein